MTTRLATRLRQPLWLPRNLLADCQTRPIRRPQCLRRKRPPSHLLLCLRKPRWVLRPRIVESTRLRFAFHPTYMVGSVQPVSRSAPLPTCSMRHLVLTPPLSVVVRPSGIADRTSPTADRSRAHAATTRHRDDPYQLVRVNQHVPAQSTIDPIVDYKDDWKPYRVGLYKDKRWWEWDHGIIDVRPLFPARSTASAGTQLGVGYDACRWVLRRHACEFKVGMARMLGSRWGLYRSSPDTWTPSHLFIVMHVRGRDAVGFAEAGLIGMLHACDEYDDGLNVNARNNDKGGSGPRHECELDDWFWVYLATKSVS